MDYIKHPLKVKGTKFTQDYSVIDSPKMPFINEIKIAGQPHHVYQILGKAITSPNNQMLKEPNVLLP
jgi:small ligand-binding sensory domain FIST